VNVEIGMEEEDRDQKTQRIAKKIDRGVGVIGERPMGSLVNISPVRTSS